MTTFSFDKLNLITSEAVPNAPLNISPLPPALDWGILGAMAVVAARQLWDHFKSNDSNERAERDLLLKAIVERNTALTNHIMETSKIVITELVSLKK